jgi:hypothetical protein
MKLTVGTSPVMLPYKGHVTPMVQNLGPGNVYFDADQNVSASTGIQMQPGAVYEFPRDLSDGGGFIWLVADQAGCDVRIIRVG